MSGTETVHASVVDLNGRGALILGPSGSGKSRLALDLIGLGARLVADDGAELPVSSGRIEARAPEAIAGMIEVRGVGILRLEYVPATRVVLAVDLGAESAARLPQPVQFCITDACLPLIMRKYHPNLGSLVMACLRYGKEPLFLDPER